MNPHVRSANPHLFEHEQSLDRLADRLKMLGDSSRLRILSVICQREQNVGQICKLTGLKQANVSKHLRLLKSVEIIHCRRVGNCRYYQIVDSDLLKICAKPLAMAQELNCLSQLHSGKNHD